MSKSTLAILSLTFCILMFAISADSFDDQESFNADYCKNVSLWERDEEQGLSEYDRAGHPNYKGVVCEQ